MRRENLSLTKWWWWCRSCAAHCHTRGISAEAEAAGRGDTRGWPLNIGKTIAAGNTHTSLLDRCYVVNMFVSITDVFFQQRALLVGVGTTHNHKLVLLRECQRKWGHPPYTQHVRGRFLLPILVDVSIACEFDGASASLQRALNGAVSAFVGHCYDVQFYEKLRDALKLLHGEFSHLKKSQK